MARFVYNTACTLDGFIADADNSLQWLFDVPRQAEDSGFDDFLVDVAALVMGATTYRWVLESEQVLTQPEKWRGWYGDRPTWVFTHQDLPSIPHARVEFVSGPVSDHLSDLTRLREIAPFGLSEAGNSSVPSMTRALWMRSDSALCR